MLVSFSPPEVTQGDVQAVAEALQSGWITTGPIVQRFQQALAGYTGAAGCICLSSGTAALELSLRVLNIGPGDEVILPAYTYAATAHTVLRVGAHPVLCDTPPTGYHLTGQDILPHLTPRTKAIIGVDIGGVMCDYPAIIKALESHTGFCPGNDLAAAIGRPAVIADAAHALGARHCGVAAGAAGDFTAFSFHAVKNLTTGEGGALCWREVDGVENDTIARNLQLWSLQGQTRSALEKSTAGRWEYDIALCGCKCNMTDPSAALGLSQLARYPATLQRRAGLVALYNSLLAPAGLRSLCHFGPQMQSSCHLYMLDTGLEEEARNHLLAQLGQEGIAANVHFKPLPLFTAYRRLGYRIEDTPNAYQSYRGEVSLPLFSAMTTEQVEYTAQRLLACIQA